MPASPLDTTQRLRRGGGWLLYLTILTCPIGELAILALAGNAFSLTLTNPLDRRRHPIGVATGATVLIRRALRNRTTQRHD